MKPVLQKAYLLASSLLLVYCNVTAMALAQFYPDNNNQNEEFNEEAPTPQDYYSSYAEQAMAAYRKGESTKAIELMTKAFELSPNNSAVINNLAASYIQRGVYFQNTQKDHAKAISDYRQALFYLAHEWPSGVPKSQGASANIKILEDNLEGAMANLKIPVKDWKWHLQTAWDLRRKGNLHEAMVEYAWVTQLNPKHSEAWAAQGDIYTVRQRADQAVNAYRKAVDTSTAASDALQVKLGTALLKNNDPEKAVEAYNKALAFNSKNKDALLALEQIWKKEIVLNPRNMSAHLNLGAVYQQLGRYEDAHAQYQVADRLSPNNPLIKLNLGSLYQAKGQVDQALAMYDAVLQQDPGNAKVMLYKADLLKQQGKSEDAEQILQRSLQTSSDKKGVLDQLIAVYKTQGDPEKIKSGWQLYSQTFPQDPQVHYQAALAYHELKDYDGAIRFYQSALRLKPNMAEAHANLGTALHALNRDEEAIKALQKAVQLDPSLEEVKRLIATLEQQKGSQALLSAAKLHEEGKYREALQGYEQVLKQSPNNADVLSRYGLALQALKRFPEALTAYDKAIQIDANNAAYYYYKGTVYDEQNQLESAKKQYEKALSLDPQFSQAQQALESISTSGSESLLAQALSAYEQKNYAEALKQIDTVLKLDPNHAMAYYYRGLVFDAQQKWIPAQMAYQKAIELDNKLSDAFYALAVVLDTQGKKAEAKKTYQQFLELTQDQPEDDFIQYAKSRVSTL